MTHPLAGIAARWSAGEPVGITSVCSAHPAVIDAALRLALESGRPVLIEATCNQVNQDGGYTGMTPAAFRDFVMAIAAEVGLPADRIVLGGDHLGPNPWRDLPASEAMDKAEAMIAAYAGAGFTKLHLDCSMGCAGEPAALADAVVAERAARLAAAAEANAGAQAPVYVIGTEVPVPGGAAEALDGVEVTAPADVLETYGVHREAFGAAGLAEAFGRVIAVVVQPGVEFGHSDVVRFEPEAARELTASLSEMPGAVFEAHSTDYQDADALAALVRGGFCILKVGPWLTFALREALYGLDAAADVLEGHPPRGRLMAEMEAVMRAAPGNWSRYYHGDDAALWLQRHFSYSDRIRYYWPDAAARGAVGRLRARLGGREIPEPVLRQYLPGLSAGSGAMTMDDAVRAAIQNVLRLYDAASTGRATYPRDR